MKWSRCVFDQGRLRAAVIVLLSLLLWHPNGLNQSNAVRAHPSLAVTALQYLPLARYTECSPPPGASYCLRDLGTSGVDSEATAINNRGQVAGVIHIPYLRGYITHAALAQNGRLVDLNLAGPSGQFTSSWVSAINDAGQYVGWSDSRAFSWDEATGFCDLGTLGGAQSFANGINGAGAIVGSAWPRALLWQAGQMTQLDTLPGFSSSQAYQINTGGTIVGFAESSATNPDGTPIIHAVRWNGGTPTDLGAPDGYLNSHARALNDAGLIAGSLTTPEHAPNGLYIEHAASWQAGAWRDLGTLGPHLGSSATDINASGLIVGTAEISANDGQGSRIRHGVLWRESAPIDLNSLIDRQSGWEIVAASATNDRGQIVGQGLRLGERHAIVLTPAS